MDRAGAPDERWLAVVVSGANFLVEASSHSSGFVWANVIGASTFSNADKMPEIKAHDLLNGARTVEANRISQARRMFTFMR